MLRTIENEVSRQAAPPALQAEFAQHDFEKLRTFLQPDLYRQHDYLADV